MSSIRSDHAQRRFFHGRERARGWRKSSARLGRAEWQRPPRALGRFKLRVSRFSGVFGFGEMPKMSLPNFGLCVMIIYVAVRQGVAMDINERGTESLRGEDLMK